MSARVSQLLQVGNSVLRLSVDPVKARAGRQEVGATGPCHCFVCNRILLDLVDTKRLSYRRFSTQSAYVRSPALPLGHITCKPDRADHPSVYASQRAGYVHNRECSYARQFERRVALVCFLFPRTSAFTPVLPKISPLRIQNDQPCSVLLRFRSLAGPSPGTRPLGCRKSCKRTRACNERNLRAKRECRCRLSGAFAGCL